MSRFELLSPEGLRIDGRRWNELRRFTAQMSTQSTADGSSYVEHGNTKIICTVTGPCEPSARAKILHDRASVSVEVCFAAFSGGERKKRGRGDKRVAEMQTALQRTFQTCIQTHLHARSEIHISLHILSQDGSVLATCINASTLALIDAGIPMNDYMVGCTSSSTTTTSTFNNNTASGDVDADPLLDLNSAEEMDLPALTVATMGGGEKIGLLQMETKVALERLEGMVAVALDGCAMLRGIMDRVVRAHGGEMVKRGIV